MKKLTKMCLAIVLTLSMILSLGAVAFAAEADTYTGNVLSSHVEYVVDGTNICAKAFVRNYANDDTATLIIASYDAGGNLVGAASATGINKVLKTDNVILGENVKAFVWEDASKTIISEVANYSKALEEVCAGLTITLDGTALPLSSFDSNYTYTKDYGNAAEVTLPVVEASVKDNGATVKVETDEEALKTTVTVSYGAKAASTGNFTIGTKNYSWTRNGKAQTRTYTINYKVYEFVSDENKLYTDEFTPSVKTTDTIGSYEYMHKKSFAPAEGEAVGKVEFTISSATQGDIVVVKPQASTYNLDDVVVGSDGSKFAIEEDKDVGVASVENDALTYEYEKKLTGAVSVSVNSGTAAAYNLFSNLHEYGANGNIYDSGSRVASNREPLKGNMMCLGGAFNDTSSVLKGAPYIGISWNDNNKSHAFTFYVNQAVDVYVVTGSTSTSYMGDGWDATSIGGTLNKKYQNYLTSKINGNTMTNQGSYYDSTGTAHYTNVSAIPIAYGLKMGYLKEYNVVKDGTAGERYRVFPHGLVDQYGLDYIEVNSDLIKCETVDIYSKSGDTYVKSGTYNIPDAEQNLDYIQSILEISKDSAEVTPASVESIVSGVTKASAAGGTAVDVKTFEVDEIFGTGTGSYRVHPDRWNNQVGYVVQYPAVLELYGNENVRNCIGWVNDSLNFNSNSATAEADGTYSNAVIAAQSDLLRTETTDTTSYDWYNESNGKYYNAKYTWDKIKNWTNFDGVYYYNAYAGYWRATSTPFYTFTVAEDAEVLVFTTGNKDYKTLLANGSDAAKADAENWESLNCSETDAIQIFQAAATGFSNGAGRKVRANEEVTIYSPATGVHYLVFVRPIN